MELTDLLNEWFTGRLKDGAESPRLAHRWSDATVLGQAVRVYRADLRDLRGMLSPPKALGFDKITPGLAVGADGEVDIRIETAIGKEITVTRWRPELGPDGRTLGDVYDRGATYTHAVERLSNPTALADADRAGELTEEELSASSAAVKFEMVKLQQQAEAQTLLGDTAAAALTTAEVDAMRAKRTELREASDVVRGVS